MDKKVFDELFGPVFGLLDNNPLLKKLADEKGDNYYDRRHELGTRALSILKQANDLTDLMSQYQHEIMDRDTFDKVKKSFPNDLQIMQEYLEHVLQRSPEKFMSQEEVDKLKEMAGAFPKVQEEFAKKLTEWQEQDEKKPSPEKQAEQDEWAKKFRKTFADRLKKRKPGYTVEKFAEEITEQLDRNEKLLLAGKHSPAQKKAMKLMKEGVSGVLDCVKGKTSWNYQAMDAFGKLDFIYGKHFKWINSGLDENMNILQYPGDKLDILAYFSEDYLEPEIKPDNYGIGREGLNLLPPEKILEKVNAAFRKNAEGSASFYVEPDFREALDLCVSGLEKLAFSYDSADTDKLQYGADPIRMRNSAVVLRDELDRNGFTPLARLAMQELYRGIKNFYYGSHTPAKELDSLLNVMMNTWNDVPAEVPYKNPDPDRDHLKELFVNLDAAYIRAYNEALQQQIDNPKLKDELVDFNVDLESALNAKGTTAAQDELPIEKAKQIVSIIGKKYNNGVQGFVETLERQLANSERLFGAERRTQAQERVHRYLTEGAQGILKLFKENAPWDKEARTAFTKFDQACGVLNMQEMFNDSNRSWFDPKIVDTSRAIKYMLGNVIEEDVNVSAPYSFLVESPFANYVEQQQNKKSGADKWDAVDVITRPDVTIPHGDIFRQLKDNYAWYANRNLNYYVAPDLNEALSDFIYEANGRALKMDADDPKLETLRQLRSNATVLMEELGENGDPEKGLTALINLYAISHDAIPGLYDSEMAKQLEKNPPKAELGDRLKELDEKFSKLDKENAAAYQEKAANQPVYKLGPTAMQEAKEKIINVGPTAMQEAFKPEEKIIKAGPTAMHEETKPVEELKPEEEIKPIKEPVIEDINKPDVVPVVEEENQPVEEDIHRAAAPKAEEKHNYYEEDKAELNKMISHLVKAKTFTNSDEYKDLIKAVAQVNSSEDAMSSTKLSPKQNHAMKLFYVKLKINAYLTHKGKDGVKKNVYSKLAAVEELNRFVCGRIREMQPDPVQFGNIRLSADTTDVTYEEEAARYNREPLESHKLKTRHESLALSEEKLMEAYGKAEQSGTTPAQYRNALDCMGRIILDAEKNGRSQGSIDQLKNMHTFFMEHPCPKPEAAEMVQESNGPALM